MAGTDTTGERTRRQLFDLEDRVHALETGVVRTLALLAGGLLALGSVLPVYSAPSEEQLPVLRLLTAPFEIFGVTSETEDHKAFNVMMGIGFLGLLACILTAVGVCFAQWNRQAGSVATRTAKVVAWLLVIGMVVPILLTMIGASNDEGDVVSVGPALWLAVPGVVVFAVTAFNDHLRRLWAPED